ncbi:MULTISPECIES: carbohydrate ABC transporter permease [unclassified Meiothermus]|uniref:carbohydrate ABC transporter permease n=1 Tax=unclassified Meiothermus TaxID=370471 RepID=UPI000D7BC350|nr:MULTISPECIES: carbohydrate ABC transporter permease [unclassified Meiothermus]PZA06275.1 carbohydrate ABC transporter permease [Meiothermus sp. Pnk-1]RYM36397.1 carbohydrate ABC transporter permease [Meiothermus sp. PNK-Is4]
MRRLSFADALLLGALGLNALGVILPLALMLISALKPTAEIFASPFALPKVWSLENFAKVWESGRFDLYFRNSVFITLGAELLILVFSAMAAYALGRFRFGLNNLLYVVFLIGLLFPAKLVLVPLFVQLKQMGLLDSHLGLILVYAAGGVPAAVFILTGFFRSLPADLESAARIDGASEWQVFARIMLPLVRPQLAIVAIYTAIPIWNDFLLPLAFLQNPALKTVPQGLSVFFGEFATDYGPLFAGLTLAALPLILLYLLLSEQFIKGLTAGATKG